MQNIFIISGPAGSGKDAIIEGLKEKGFPFERMITTTTRAIRPGEREGHPYHFLSKEAFKRKIAAGDFAEYSTNENGEMYGVTRAELERVAKLPGLTLWKLEWKGVMTAKKLFPGIPALFITAPLPILEERLRRRDGATKDESYFQERMRYTKEWMKHTDIYDYIVENEEGKLDEAIARVENILRTSLAHSPGSQ